MKGKVAVITASSTGIGKGIALNLAKQGVKVIISSRDQKHIDETVKELTSQGLQAFGIACHVGKKEDRIKLLKESYQKYGRIDYLVANAAVSTQMGNFLQSNQAQLEKMWQINYHSTFFLVQEALPYLRKQKNSSIAIVSSYTAYELSSIIGHYAITKTALVALTKILAKELLDDEIRVNCVAPGLIKTKFSSSLWQKDQQVAAEGMGAKRLGVPEDIASVVKFMLSEESSYMTGECIVVAGRPSPRL